MIVGRITGYVIRLRVLSEGKLSIIGAIRIVLLWEFSSAVTPSAVGGTSVALLFLYKEGLSIGKGSAIVLATLFLDELYFVLVFPLVVLLVGWTNLFELSASSSIDLMQNKYFYFAIAGYSVMLFIALLVGYGLFINPHALKKFIVLIFSLPGLRKWKQGAINQGNEIVKASKHLSNKPFKFWLQLHCPGHHTIWWSTFWYWHSFMASRATQNLTCSPLWNISISMPGNWCSGS
jgi:hypothetical protein